MLYCHIVFNLVSIACLCPYNELLQVSEMFWSLPGAPGSRVSLVRLSAFRTITLMRWPSIWYCSRMNSWPKARGTHTKLFLWPNVSWELTLWGEERGKDQVIKEKERKRESQQEGETFPLSLSRCSLLHLRSRESNETKERSQEKFSFVSEWDDQWIDTVRINGSIRILFFHVKDLSKIQSVFIH